MGAYDDKQFGVNDSDGADDDKGEAMKRNPKFDGPSEEDVEYENTKSHSAVSAAQMNNGGRE